MLNTHLSLRWPFLHRTHRTLGSRTIGGIALAGSTVAGSTYNAFAKPLTGFLSPLSLLFVSEVLTAFFVLLSFGVVPTMKRLLQIHRRHVLPLLCIGVCSSVLGPLFWFLNLRLNTAMSASIFGKIDLVIMLVLAHLMLGERLRRKQIVAATVIMAGLITVSLRGFSEALTFRLADFFVIASGLSFAFGSIIFRKYLSDIEAHVALLVRTLIAITAFFLISPFLTHPFIEEITSLPPTLLPTLIGFGFISRFLNISLYYQAIDRLPVMTVSLVTTLDIVGSSFFAYWYLGESLHWYHAAGIACVILGNILLELTGLHPTHAHHEQHLRHRVGHRP